MVATCALSVASHWCGSISPPASRTRASVSVMASRLLSAANTFAPSCAKITAMARPLPQPGPTQPAPLTIATLPCSLPAMLFPRLALFHVAPSNNRPNTKARDQSNDAGRKFREERTMRKQAGASAQATDFKVGISEPVNTVLAMWMADAAGAYAAQGLKDEIINMSGGSRGAQELAAGRIDVMHVGLSSVVRLNRGGANLRFIASLSNVIRFTFFSGPNVKTAADLKGGAVGVSTFGSESDATVTLALQRLRLTRADVEAKEDGGGVD